MLEKEIDVIYIDRIKHEAHVRRSILEILSVRSGNQIRKHLLSSSTASLTRPLLPYVNSMVSSQREWKRSVILKQIAPQFVVSRTRCTLAASI